MPSNIYFPFFASFARKRLPNPELRSIFHRPAGPMRCKKEIQNFFGSIV